jgi:hypothetical protein
MKKECQYHLTIPAAAECGDDDDDGEQSSIRCEKDATRSVAGFDERSPSGLVSLDFCEEHYNRVKKDFIDDDNEVDEMLLDEEEEEERGEDDGNNQQNRQKSEHFCQNLHFSKLILPENHPGIPQDWLKQEILQLQDHGISPGIFKILDPKGNDIPLDDFIHSYENGLKVHDFIKVPKCFRHDEVVKNTTSEVSEDGHDEKNTTNENQEDGNRQKPLNFGHFGQMIQKAMIDCNGVDKGYFTVNDLAFHLMMLPGIMVTLAGTLTRQKGS